MRDLKSLGGNSVRVGLPPPAPKFFESQIVGGTERRPPFYIISTTQKTKEALCLVFGFSHRHFLPGGAAILTVASFLSYLAGLFRDRVFARTFGAGPELDAYNASFILPDLLFNVFIAGALSSAFIPIFTDLFSRGKLDESQRVASTVIHVSVTLMGVSGILLFIFAPFMSHSIAPGFNEDTRSLLVNLLRIMAFSPVLFAASNALGGMLVGYRRFLFYGLSPVLYNVGIIIGTLVLSPLLGVYGVALGVLLGAFLHLGVRVFDILRTPFRYMPVLDIKNAHFKKIIRLMIPQMVGHPVELITFWGFTAIASTIRTGDIAVLNFARNFQSVPVSLFGIAFATSILPLLSEYATKDEWGAYARHFFKTLRGILVFTLPAALFMFLFRKEIIGFFLGGGSFDEEAVLRTALTLGVFTLAIPTESMNHLLARSFYALKNTVIPVTVNVGGLGIALSFGYIFSHTMGVAGLPLGFFLGSIFRTVVLGTLLFRRVRLF